MAAETDEQLIQRACNRYGLDPALNPCYISKNGKRRALLSAAGYDMVAFKTGEYLGADEVEFGPDQELVKPKIAALHGLSIPEYAKQTVYRNTAHGTATFTAKIYAQEYINDASHVRNIHMFMSKWVHCVAIRLAFPDVLGSEVALEELDAQMDFTKGSTGAVELKIIQGDTMQMNPPGSPVTIHHPPILSSGQNTCGDFQGTHIYLDGVLQSPPNSITAQQDVDALVAECFK